MGMGETLAGMQGGNLSAHSWPSEVRCVGNLWLYQSSFSFLELSLAAHLIMGFDE